MIQNEKDFSLSVSEKYKIIKNFLKTLKAVSLKKNEVCLNLSGIQLTDACKQLFFTLWFLPITHLNVS